MHTFNREIDIAATLVAKALVTATDTRQTIISRGIEVFLSRGGSPINSPLCWESTVGFPFQVWYQEKLHLATRVARDISLSLLE